MLSYIRRMLQEYYKMMKLWCQYMQLVLVCLMDCML